MRRTIATFVLFAAVWLGAVPAVGGPESAARVGLALADAWISLAPLVEFYDAYAALSFLGSPVVVPVGAATALPGFEEHLVAVHEAMVVQTPPQSVEALARVVRLRHDAQQVSESCGEALAELAEGVPMASEEAGALADAGLFRAIRGLQVSAEETLDAALQGAGEEEGRWRLAVTFALRVLALRGVGREVPATTRDILFGGEGREDLPFSAPEQVAGAMLFVASNSGQTLDPATADEILEAVQVILDYMTAGEV
ncbi:MAG: hypothetical protein AB1778_07200 [Candidatus Bipolaricaulota bacterium]